MKQKGFTLIELLAVIVVLAIIALIAVPIIMGIVEKSTKGSVKASAYGYIDAVEKSVMKKLIETNSGSYSGTYLINGNKLVRINPDDEFTFDIIIKGSKDISGELVIGSKGRIDSAILYQKSYEANYDGKIVTIGDLGEIKVQKIMFDEEQLFVQAGGTEQLNLLIYPSAATNRKITYTSSNDSIATVDANGVVTTIKGGNVTITAVSDNGKTDSIDLKIGYENNATINADSIYDLMLDEGITASGTYTVSLSNGVNIDTEIYVINDDTIYEANPTLCDDVLDTKMCIYKYTGDLTINKDVTVTPQTRKKGFVMYVAGTLTNNGAISMTARGAKAAGQNVQLYKNESETFETIPATGAAGAAGQRMSNGVTGTSGTARKTGGGGSGAGRSSGTGGNAAAGTSYSGGSGGGGCDADGGCHGGHAVANGGAGGAGTRYGGGGAGNPGGTHHKNGPGGTGTGGLLIIYVNDFNNNGLIVSNGTAGGGDNYVGKGGAGGGSGAGSINIFYKNLIEKGSITATGGAGGKSGRPGGAGGEGSITIGSIETGTFVAN